MTEEIIKQYNVSEISIILKSVIEDSFRYVRIKGEISGLKTAPSGHTYFSLKDQNSVIASICWRGVLSKNNFKLEDGLEVICTGSITIYSGQSKYQLIVDRVETAGIGALMAVFIDRKNRLEKEGLFLKEKKKKIPFLPKSIGIITSPTGAVIKDIIHRIKDRMPTRIILWPTLVQGEQAANQIADAIDGFNKITNNQNKPDVIIIARGGGSIEDLWCFNEEIIVRAVANSTIPIISAIGHETDTTLIDYASDLRAPTPTAAAEMAVPVKSEIIKKLIDIEERLFSNLEKFIIYKKQNLFLSIKSIPNFDHIILNKEQSIDDQILRIDHNINNIISKKYNYINSYLIENIKNRFKSDLQNLKILFISIENKFKIFLQQINYNITTIGDMKIDHMNNRIDYLEDHVNIIFQKINYNVSDRYKFNANKIVNYECLIESYNYKKVLNRGFSIVRDEKNVVINSVESIENKNYFQIEFKDGIKKFFI